MSVCPKCSSPAQFIRIGGADIQRGYECGSLDAQHTPACEIIAGMRPVIDAAIRFRDSDHKHSILAECELADAVDVYRKANTMGEPDINDQRTTREIIREELHMWVEIRNRSERTKTLAIRRIETMRKALCLTDAQLERMCV